MKKKLIYSSLIIIFVIILDRLSKNIFLAGYEWHFTPISFYLVFNDGVAFSMLSFLQGYLKYIQIILLMIAGIFLVKEKKFLNDNYSALSFILAGGMSNIYDRFFYPGVIDFIAWHYWFNFAVFNIADVCINLGVFIIILKEIIKKRS
ncbi:lipoprotein signal peptidase [Campylobacter sp. Cr9]|uniref:signal peptidase II n=1 Tax=unclassified Campylobacter TaxID=2593542 RepID=UPI001EFC233F|nr:signal peptidase II [Campylobacter sp. RM5004]MBZ7985726.1 lipoprotein signal peptidase [Campylobacter sp. Cr9]ULO01406.1 prolipoprotein signal peptidase II [Campylobacter sp. RM5004]